MIDFLLDSGYIRHSDNNSWEIWSNKFEDREMRVYIPKAGNTAMLYDYTLQGSPKSYVEFHNYLNPLQIERIKLLAV